MADKKSVLELTDQLEKILHEDLPSVAREIQADGSGPVEQLRATVTLLDTVTREIGMAVFEALRKGEPMPLPGTARAREPEPEGEFSATTDLSGSILENVEQAQETADNRGPQVERPKPKCGGCARFSESQCGDCKGWFCQRHIHPSVHPCG